jgi:16S rRNA (guanine527-N7)-methyltransferase
LSRRSHDPLDNLLVALRSLTEGPVGPDDRRRFQQYLDLFLRWNRTYRMTALESPDAIVQELFIDSLLFLPLLPSRPLTLLDIGAGAGIPGLPLRLADPAIAVTLVEARRKRISFLLAAQRELGLGNLTVKEGRAEALVEQERDLGAAFDVVVARSVGPAIALWPVARKYLKRGGLLVVAGPPNPLPQKPFEVVRVPIPGTRKSRAFLKSIKES